MPYILGTRGLKRHFPLVISLFLDTLRYIATLRTSPDSIFLARRCPRKEKSIMLILMQSMRPSFLWRASPTQPPSSKSLLRCEQKGTLTRSQRTRLCRCRSVGRLEKLKEPKPPRRFSPYRPHHTPQTSKRLRR